MLDQKETPGRCQRNWAVRARIDKLGGPSPCFAERFCRENFSFCSSPFTAFQAAAFSFRPRCFFAMIGAPSSCPVLCALTSRLLLPEDGLAIRSPRTHGGRNQRVAGMCFSLRFAFFFSLSLFVVLFTVVTIQDGVNCCGNNGNMKEPGEINASSFLSFLSFYV